MFTKTIVGEARPAGYDSQTIYNWFHGGPGPQPACSVAEETLKQITKIHADVHTILKNGIEESRAFWTGGAAESARGGMSPMVAWADGIKQVADGAQKQVTLLRDAFFRAKNSVEPPSPSPDAKQITVGILGIPDASQFVKSMQRWQANLEHNVRVAEGYGTSSTTAAQAMPEFGQPEGAGGEVKPPEAPPRDPGPPRLPPDGRGPRGGGDLGGGAWQGAGQNSAGQGDTGQSGTGQSSTGQSGGSESASFVPPPPQHGQAGPQPWRPEGGNGGADQGLGGAIGGLGAMGGLALGAGGSGDAGTTRGTGRPGAGPGIGQNSGQNSGQGSGQGGQGGRGTPGEAGRGVAGMTPAARGGAKPGAAPMAGPMGGQTGTAEDEEHQRPSWLVEVDDVFTNDMQKVAPPVIGEEP